MLSLLIGGIVAEAMGFSYAFLLAGGVGAVGLLLSMWVVEKRPDNVKAPGIAELFSVVRNRQLLYVSFLAVLTQYINFATTFGFTPLVAVNLGAANYQLGLLGVAAMLSGLIVAPFAGTLLPKHLGIKWQLVIGFSLAGLACIATPFARSIWQLFFIQAVNNVGMVTVYTLLTGLSIRDIANEYRATAMGFFQAVFGLGIFLGPFVMGWVIHGAGLDAAFVFTGFVGILGMAASVIFVGRGLVRVKV